MNPNIRTRSAYTFFNSLLKIDDIVNHAIKNDFSYAFLIDKNNMHGAMEFYLKAKKRDVKPIIGLEVEYQDNHKILIAKNYQGYQKLMKIASLIGLRKPINEVLVDKNIIEVPLSLPIHSFVNKKDLKTLEMFSSISNLTLEINNINLIKDVNPEVTDLLKQIETEVNLEIEFKTNIVPQYIHENKKVNSKIFLQDLLKQELKKFVEKYEPSNQKEYLDRMMYEYSVISDMGYEDYFLIVWDIISWSKKQGIFVGPGRGSAAGSLISYLLNITTIDPIKNNLLFERFLNPERISLPDIDIDFEDIRRDEVINYILEKYGKENVAQIITFQTLRARMSLKDIARIKGLTPTEADSLSKLVPEGMTLEEAYTSNKKFKLNVDSSDKFTEVFESAKLIEGLPRQHSTHAAGVVLSNNPIWESSPIQKGYSNVPLTQYPMDYMEINGLLKIDVLGLRNLSFIKEIINSTNAKIDLENTPLDDSKVYKLLSQGKTSGIFQLESPGMTKVLKEMKPTNFEDIVATTSLFRPGPQKQISHYIARKHGKEKIDYLTDELKPILEPTYGIIVYQEQIMSLAQTFSGLTLAKADILRRAIGKKEMSLIKELKEEFTKGALNIGHDEKLINKVYSLIEEFAEYGFNRSHAFAYSVLSYQLAWLKERYPIEFIVALLNSYIGNSDKTNQYISEAQSLGIDIVRPDINLSTGQHQKKDKKVVLGLSTINGIGVAVVKEILSLRENGDFEDFIDFIVRSTIKRISTANIDQLILSGALDSFGLSRNTMLENKDNILTYANIIRIEKDEEVLIDKSIAPAPLLIESKEEDNLSQMEAKTLGFILSDHPFKKQAETIKQKIEFTPANELSWTQGEPIVVAGSIINVRKLTTKTNMEMAFISIEDHTGKISVTLWPATFSKFEDDIKLGSIVLIEGKQDIKRNPTIILNNLKVVKKV